MTAAQLEPPQPLFAEARRFRPADRPGTTLEERLESALRAVRSEGLAECPVCRAGMRAEGGSACCTGCGATLA